MLKTGFLKNVYFFKHRSIFIKFLSTLLVFIIVPILLISWIYINISLNSIQNEILNSDRIILNRLTDIMDRNLNSVEQSLLNQLIYNDVPLNVLNGEPEYLKAALDKTRQNLSKIKITNEMVSDVFIYYKKPKIVVTSNVVYDFDVFFGALHKYEKYDCDWWNSYFNKNKYKTMNFIPSMDILECYSNRSTVLTKAVTFIRGFDQFREDPSIVYGIILKESEITKLIRQLNITQNGFVCLYDSQGSIIYSTDRQYKIADETDSQKYTTLSNNSSEYGLGYKVFIPSDEVVNRSRYINSLFIFLCCIAITVAIIVAVIASGNMYKPINKIIELIDKGVKSNTEKNKNEFEYISSNIGCIINDTENLNTALKKSLPFSREKILTNLIKGKCSFYDEDPEILRHFDIKLDKGAFVVFAIKIDDFKALKMKCNELDIESFKFVLSNISEELSAPNGVCFSSGDNEICLILNYDSSEPVNRNLLSIAQAIKESIKDYLPLTVTIGISTVKRDIHDLCKCYEEAVTALNYRIFGSRDQIIEHDYVSSLNQDYYYPVEKEKSIINYFKAGDYINSVNVIENILDENLTRNISHYHMTYILSELLSAVLKAVYEMEGKIQDIFNVSGSLGKDLYENETVEDIKLWFEKTCKRLCDYVIDQRESGNTESIKKINQFIQDNYYKDITLEIVADQFNMSYSYLSRYFKQQTGINFIDYLYQLKIEKAKEMLKNPASKINQIAESVGFYNVNNFIRMFKKFEGITPGKFKGTCK